jgi:uncharacterized protein YcfJ
MKIIGILIAGVVFVGQTSAQEHASSAPVPSQAASNQPASNQPAPNQEGMHYGWADVLRVDPVYDDAAPSAPHEECYEEQVLEQPQAAEPDNGKRAGATVLGAIIGGIIGNRFGKGDGRKAATAAGAVAGGVVGNNVAAGQEAGTASPPPKYTTQRRCHQIDGPGAQRRVAAYDVEYRYRGEVYSTRLSYDPGNRMRVRVSVTPAE